MSLDASLIRLRTRTACASCKREHAHCDDNRPCQRCCLRGQSDKCLDVENKKKRPNDRLLRHTPLEAFQLEHMLGSPDLITLTTFQTESSTHLYQDQMQDGTIMYRPLNNSSLCDIPSQASLESDEGLPPSLWLEDWFIQRMFFRLIDRGVYTIEEGKILMNKAIQTIAKRINNLQTFITIDQRSSMTQEHSRSLQVIVNTCSSLPIPSLVWMSCCIIVHANEAFRRLAGYNQTSPSPLEDLSVLDLLDHSTIREFITTLFKEGIMTTGLSHRTMPANMPYFRGASVQRSIPGTLTMSITRDIFGLPTFYTAHFLPLPSVLEQFPFT
ncbi:hypothetical protein PROFUN_05401 [Planoprotostelium fungivorum]|uniref:Zn(2)-C6 fungal-type domain-containing protein n=1 Tax=Planoprotostelium fungivorum TaxID=1890364 RepID=A0A2P6NQN2_9EUKA|nr:hypothetical protein PROFUN_05401 [Planoprotostelium fungivorum]